MNFCAIKVDLISTIRDLFRQSDSYMMSGEARMHGRKLLNPAMGNDSKWACRVRPHYTVKY
jgi:hypothetical protein